MGYGEVSVQMLHKANLYLGNTRLAEIKTLLLDGNTLSTLPKSVIEQLVGLENLLASRNAIREIPQLPVGLTRLDLSQYPYHIFFMTQGILLSFLHKLFAMRATP